MATFPTESARDFVEERLGLLSDMVLPAVPRSAAQTAADAAEERNVRATREGFVQGRVVWFGGEGDWRRDFFFHVENSHTLLGLARGHAMHPFERFDRGCYLACVLFLNLFLAAVVARDHAPVLGSDGRPDWLRSGDYVVSLSAASILNLVYDRVLRVFATCACLQRGGALFDVCCLCRDCFRDLGKLGLYCALMLSFAIAVVGCLIAAHLDAKRHFFKTFVAMKLLAWCFEFAPLGFVFYRRRETQKPYWGGDPRQRATGGAYPLGCDVPPPAFLRERRADASRFAHESRDRRERRDASAARRQRRARDRRDQAARLDRLTRAGRGAHVVASTREAAASVELGAAGNPFRDDDDAAADDDPLDTLGRR